MSRQTSCFEPFVYKGYLRFKYKGATRALEGQYIRIFLAHSILYVREDQILTYQQNPTHIIDLVTFYNTVGEQIDPHTLTLSYEDFEQQTLESINRSIVAATGSANSLVVHRKGLIYQDEWQAGYKGSTTLADMKYKLALEMVKHSEIDRTQRSSEDRQATIQTVVAAMRTEEEVQQEYNDCYYIPFLQALLHSAVEQLTCPPLCATRRTGNNLARLNEQKNVVILASPQYQRQLEATIYEDNLQARSEMQDMLDEGNPRVQCYQINDESYLHHPPVTLEVEDITYHRVAQSLFGMFYVYEATVAGPHFQPHQTMLNPSQGKPYLELVKQLPVILQKSDRQYIHTIDPENIFRTTPHERCPSILKGVSANDIAQVLGLPEDPVCPHYGYEWFHLERSSMDGGDTSQQHQMSWHNVVLITWRCSTMLHRIEALIQKVLQSDQQKLSMHNTTIKDAQITIKPSYIQTRTRENTTILLPQRLEYNVSFNISHPVTTKKALHYTLNALSNRQPAYIETRLDEAIVPNILKSWSVESIRQRIHKNMTAY
jgi:hypothetical protein